MRNCGEERIRPGPGRKIRISAGNVETWAGEWEVGTQLEKHCATSNWCRVSKIHLCRKYYIAPVHPRLLASLCLYPKPVSNRLRGKKSSVFSSWSSRTIGLFYLTFVDIFQTSLSKKSSMPHTLSVGAAHKNNLRNVKLFYWFTKPNNNKTENRNTSSVIPDKLMNKRIFLLLTVLAI